MAGIVTGMDKALKEMDVEKVGEDEKGGGGEEERAAASIDYHRRRGWVGDDRSIG
jgi:hypothetical protein